jgi:hypothetical protein
LAWQGADFVVYDDFPQRPDPRPSWFVIEADYHDDVQIPFHFKVRADSEEETIALVKQVVARRNRMYGDTYDLAEGIQQEDLEFGEVVHLREFND